jgi:hypothetical protein
VRDWEQLAMTDHYHTAVAIREALKEGDVNDATAGIEELIEALSRSEERALESHLIRLMQHIIKWHVQPGRRSRSWIATIREARKRVRQLQRRYPRFTDERILELWEDCFDSGINEAEKDMNQEVTNPPTITWHDAFEAEYRLG